MQGPHAVAVLIKGACLTARRRGYEVPILRIEQKDQTQQDRQQPLIQMGRLLRGQAFDAGAIRLVQAAQQFVQGAKHLGGELGGDLRLGIPARLEQGGKPPLGGVVVQPEGGQQQPEAAKHWPAGHAAKRTQREGQPAARLTARRVDQTDLIVGQQQARGHPGLAQQTFQPLVGCCLPPRHRAALIRINAARRDLDEHLPATAGRRDRPVRRQPRFTLGQPDGEFLGQTRPAWRAGHLPRAPTEDLPEEPPRVGHCRTAFFLRKEERHLFGVQPGLLLGHQPMAREHGWRDDKANRLDVAEPLAVWIGGRSRTHHSFHHGDPSAGATSTFLMLKI